MRRALGLALVLAACTGAPASEDEAVDLSMGFVPNVQYAPFYVAIERGYFAEEGIELNLDYSTERTGVELVASGDMEFALVSGEQVPLARAQGLPVVYVMAWWQDYPIAVAAAAGSGIEAPEDLAGRCVGIPGLFGASYVGFRALLHSAGVSESEACLDTIGFNQVQALAAGQQEAVVVYANNEPIQLEARGYPVSVIRVADHVKLASNGLLTSEATLAERSTLVEGMVRAALRGLADTIADPDSAFEISKSYVDGLAELTPEEQALQRRVLEASIRFWETERPGLSSPAAWSNMQDVLLEMGLLSEPLDIEQAYTNEFIP